MIAKINFLIALFPVIFMIHDFEEIIMFEPWLTKNREILKKRFPLIERFFAKQGFFELSTSAFAVAVCYEFLLLSLITFTSLYFQSFNWWFAIFMAYFLHLFLHLIQWVILKKYIPVLLTTILTMPYCFYTAIVFWDTTTMSLSESIVWILVGVLLLVIGVYSALALAIKFEKWKNRKYCSNSKK